MMKWTEVLKRRLLGGTMKTVEHDGKFFAVYDGIAITRDGDRLTIALTLEGRNLFEFEPQTVACGNVLIVSGLRGEQEIKLDS